MKRLILFVFAALFITTANLSAQLGPQAFLPSECRSGALTTPATAGWTDARLVGIATIGLDVPLGIGQPVDLGFQTSDGKARLWAYLVYSPSRDSMKAVPYVRIFGTCVDPSTLTQLPTDDISFEGVGTMEIPASPLEGSQLITRLIADNNYAQFSANHPDSMPFVVALTVSEEDFGEFAAGTPYWVLTWLPTDDGTAMTCLVHATTGETFCFLETTNSVDESAEEANVVLAPNPVGDLAVITVPQTWLGSSVHVDIVDVTGTLLQRMSYDQLSSTSLVINSSQLSRGVYTARLHTGNRIVSVPFVK